MIRSGIFIGVDKTGNLLRLRDAAAGAKRMYEWALAQGIADQTHARLITDSNGKRVHPDLIYDAIKELIDGAGVDQFLIYFAGHGVNINRNEHWLLTDAPVRTSAAVNVSGSVELARYCGIHHVVIISDACRVAPEGIQAQNVRGVDIFPNEGGSDRARPVDQFFACCLGKTAAELQDPADAAANYSALYTTVLLDALYGKNPELLEAAEGVEEDTFYIRPRPLESHLETAVPLRVKAMQLEKKVNQNPDAIITSGDGWISRIKVPGILSASRAPEIIPSLPPTLARVSQELVRTAMASNRKVLGEQLEHLKAGRIIGGKALANTAERIAVPFGPDHFETQCGFKVRGARIVDVFAPRADVEVLGVGGDLLRINRVEPPAASVLLVFEGGVGTVVPALPEFLTALTFDDGQLVDVTYEPSVNSSRWDLYRQRASDVRALRAVAASSSQYGRFRLEHADAFQIAQRMQYAKGIDPTLAVYSAYAYHDLQEVEKIREMSSYLRGDVGATFFDLALLSRALVDKGILPDNWILPFVPLLSQGWALLSAHRVKLHPALAGIERTTRDSLWSLFDRQGVDKLRRAMQTGDVR